jgi:O-antigen ligase
MISSLIIFSSIFLLISKNDEMMKNRYYVFLHEFNRMFEPKLTEKVNPKKEIFSNVQFLRSTGHDKIYLTALNVSKMQPIFGFGLKSFRVKCWDSFGEETLKANKSGAYNVGCSNHPHNYYLEILVEAGIVGLILIIFFFITVLKKSLIYLFKYNNINDKNKYLLLPMIIIFFMEIWPIRSSGSFFTNYNASLIWLNIAILLALLYRRENQLV